MKRGEVRWYQFGRPDKKRPVVILTRGSMLEYMGEVSVASITSTIRDIPTEVVLGRIDGMPKDCVVNCDHLQTVSKAKLGAIVTTLSPGKLSEVRRAVSFALGF